MIDRQSMLAAGLLLGSLAVPGEAKTLIHAGRLFDGRGDSLRTAVTVTVDGDRITNVQDGYAAGGPGDTVVDLRTARCCRASSTCTSTSRASSRGRPDTPSASS